MHTGKYNNGDPVTLDLWLAFTGRPIPSRYFCLQDPNAAEWTIWYWKQILKCRELCWLMPAILLPGARWPSGPRTPAPDWVTDLLFLELLRSNMASASRQTTRLRKQWQPKLDTALLVRLVHFDISFTLHRSARWMTICLYGVLTMFSKREVV
jgi:hypothetical protein